MTQSVPEYFTLLPSEICRLVLGYLLHTGPESAAKVLFNESVHLSELRAQYKTITDLPLHLTQLTLLDLVHDYLRIANSVAHQLSRLGVVCRLGAVSTVLPHLLKTNVSNANTTISRRVTAVRPTRPSWMPLGKTYLPPRIVPAEHNRPVRLPLLAVRPHLYSESLSSSGSLGGTSTATDSITQLPSIVNVQGNVGPEHPLTSESSSCSTAQSRPVIRLYRNPVGAVSSSVLNMIEEQSIEEPGDNIAPSPPCSQTIPSPEYTEPVPTDSDLENAITDEVKPTVVGEVDLGVPDEIVVESKDPATSLLNITDGDNDEQSKLESSTISDVSVKTEAPFTVLQHLPPPTEATPTSNVDSSCDRVVGETVTTGLSTTKKRKWIPPRHMTAAPETSDSKITAPPTESTTMEADVDLERFIAALLAHPEQVAHHINSKISSQSKAIDVQTLSVSSPAPPTEPGIVPFSNNPTKPASTLAVSSSLQVSSPPECHVTTVSEAYDPHFGLLNTGDLDCCIDRLLSEFESGETQMDELQDPFIPSATPIPAEVTELTIPSRAPTPTIQAKQPESKPSATIAPRPPTPRRPASPLCLSELTRTTMLIESPKKRRRVQPKAASKGGVLLTPDGKVPDLDLPPAHSLNQELFSTEGTLQFYEEFTGFGRSSLPSPVALPPHTVEHSRPCVPIKPKPSTVQVATSHFPMDMVQLSSMGSSVPFGGEAQRWLPEFSTNAGGWFSAAPPHSPTVISTPPTVVQSSVLPHVSTLLPSSEHRGARVINSSTAAISASYCPTLVSSTGASINYTTSTTSAVAGSIPQPPVLHFSPISTANGSPQTILLYPTVQQNTSSPMVPISREALKGLQFLTSGPPGSTSTSFSSSVDQLGGKPVIIQLPSSASFVGTSMAGQLQTVCLPTQSQWQGQQTTIILPFNVDLDSPNPHARPAPGSVHCTARKGTNTNSDKENRPPLVVKTSSRRKVLDLGSLDVDQILSKSH